MTGRVSIRPFQASAGQEVMVRGRVILDASESKGFKMELLSVAILAQASRAFACDNGCDRRLAWQPKCHKPASCEISRLANSLCLDCCGFPWAFLVEVQFHVGEHLSEQQTVAGQPWKQRVISKQPPKGDLILKNVAHV